MSSRISRLNLSSLAMAACAAWALPLTRASDSSKTRQRKSRDRFTVRARNSEVLNSSRIPHSTGPSQSEVGTPSARQSPRVAVSVANDGKSQAWDDQPLQQRREAGPNEG